MKHFKLRLALGSALAFCLAAPAFAQEADDAGLDEIVVTADRTGLRALQETPIAVSVVDGDLMDQQGLNTVTDLVAYVPNLAVSRNISGSIVSLRGIGSNGGTDPSVATQVDGVYISNSVAFTDFFDVERVEVLRGPQGTLYGRNTTGGTINFISRRPSDEFGGRMQVSYGNFAAVEASGYVTGPVLGDTLTASLALTYRERDAFFENIAPGGADIDTNNNGGARLQVRWEPAANIDATTRIDYFTADQFIESYDHLLAPLPFAAPLANSLVGSFDEVALNFDQSMTLRTSGISEEINWNFAENFTLTSITSARRFQSRAQNDNDATELNLLAFRSGSDTEQFSQEVDLRYDGDALNFVAGVYYFSATDNPSSRVTAPPSVFTPANRSAARAALPTLETESIAVFANADYEIIDNLSVILGLRYTEETTSFTQHFTATSLNPATFNANLAGFPVNFSIEDSDNALTPKFGLDYEVSDDIFLYASATRGFKSGGFNGQATSPLTAGYAPELIWSYEVGAKTEWFEDRLRLNVTGFRYDYTDLQVRQLLGPGNSVIANAASATVEGIEVEMLARPSPDLQFSAIGSFLDARYESFPTASIPGGFSPYVPNQNCVGGVCTIDASGNFLSDAPEWSGMFAVDYTPTIGAYELAFHVDYSYRSERYFDPSNVAIASQDGYGLLNGNIRFSPLDNSGWEIGLFGRNLTDEDYYQTVSGNGIVPGGIVGDPRTYGVRVGVSW
jgi:iron complex outermembrane receptor protein